MKRERGWEMSKVVGREERPERKIGAERDREQTWQEIGTDRQTDRQTYRADWVAEREYAAGC